jgi:hypothetical protein
MQNTEQYLPLLNLNEKERSSLPLGYSHIYTKDISSKQAEKSTTIYSKKYKKADLFSLASRKPISKILI